MWSFLRRMYWEGRERHTQTETERREEGRERNRDLPLQQSNRKERAKVGGVSLKGTFTSAYKLGPLDWPGYCLSTSCQMTGQASIMPES